MIRKIQTLASKPSSYVLLFIGAVLAMAFPAIRRIAAPIAARFPGAA